MKRRQEERPAWKILKTQKHSSNWKKLYRKRSFFGLLYGFMQQKMIGLSPLDMSYFRVFHLNSISFLPVSIARHVRLQNIFSYTGWLDPGLFLQDGLHFMVQQGGECLKQYSFFFRMEPMSMPLVILVNIIHYLWPK